MDERGKGMAADIAGQPEGYARLLGAEHAGAIAEVAARVAAKPPRHVVFTARGTSDHAALYAAYLTEIRLGIPAGLASPSAVTLYGARPDLRDALVVGVSQSGGSDDLVQVITAARASGAQTLAVTNNAGSPLAAAAELHIDVAAGHERAVAATKTYTAELLALLMLVEGVRAGDGRLPDGERAALAELPDLATTVLDDPTPVELAPRYRFAARVLTTGRGYAYPTARETALKLMETSYRLDARGGGPARGAPRRRGERRSVRCGRCGAADRYPGGGRALRAAAGHPAVATARAGPGARPGRGPGRAARPVQGDRHPVMLMIASAFSRRSFAGKRCGGRSSTATS